MAKILYGVAGEGSGHSSRASEIIRHLENNGHQVKVVSYDRGYKNLKPFFDVAEISGLNFDYQDNEVRYLSTIYKNLIRMPKAAKSIDKVLKLVGNFKPQIVFSDFEPISCIVANLKKIPLVSVDNQHRINNTRIDYPKRYRNEFLAARAVTDLMIFGSVACLVTTFSEDRILNKKTFLFSPILRKSVIEKKTKIGNYLLVYLTSNYRGLLKILKEIDANFIIYGLNENKIDGNLIFKKAASDKFLDDLANCQGVIANAGFTLISEALYLGKPYLALPVKGQFEQVLNAYYVDKLGYGKFWDDLDREKVEAFLYNIENYRKNLENYKHQDNKKILRMVDKLIEKYAK